MRSADEVSHTPTVSIIVPCRNEADSIARCLASVFQQAPPAGGFEIIVADGMSEDGTREVLRELVKNHDSEIQVRVIDNPGRIVSTGLNAAIRAAQGDIIVRMDSHTEYARDYVQQCVACLRETQADNVGGPARTRPQTYLQRAVAAAYHSPFAVGGARFHNVNYEGCVDTVTYGCWRKSAFQRFGGFDEGLVRNQDDEHNLRIHRGGGRVWQSPRIQSWYHPRNSLSALFRQYLQYGYWKVRVIQKHRLPASWRHLVPGAFVASLLGLVTLFLGLALGSFLVSSTPGPLAAALESGSELSFAFLMLILCLYGGAVGMASLWTAARSGWDLFPILPLVFPCYQVGYGWGFLRGLWDFVIIRRRAGSVFTQLTRGVGTEPGMQPGASTVR